MHEGGTLHALANHVRLRSCVLSFPLQDIRSDVQRENPYCIGGTGNFQATSERTLRIVQHVMSPCLQGRLAIVEVFGMVFSLCPCLLGYLTIVGNFGVVFSIVELSDRDSPL